MRSAAVEPAVLTVLAAAETDGTKLRLTGELGRTLYGAVDRVLTAAGGKWDRKARAHVFPGGAAEALRPILANGAVERRPSEQQILGAFYSPAPVADRVIELAQLRTGLTVLEPSAGRGALAARALLAGGIVTCVEIDRRSVEILCSMSFRAVVHRDFLDLDPVQQFDRVVMNPPFAPRGTDVLHVERALEWLRPGGRLVAVMSGATLSRSDRASALFRERLSRPSAGWEHLPPNSFRESGTDASAMIVTIDKEGE